jgi:hypothetical protein
MARFDETPAGILGQAADVPLGWKNGNVGFQPSRVGTMLGVRGRLRQTLGNWFWN